MRKPNNVVFTVTKVLFDEMMSQVEGIGYYELFLPVIHFKTVRLMLTPSALEGWHMQGLDV